MSNFDGRTDADFFILRELRINILIFSMNVEDLDSDSRIHY